MPPAERGATETVSLESCPALLLQTDSSLTQAIVKDERTGQVHFSMLPTKMKYLKDFPAIQ